MAVLGAACLLHTLLSLYWIGTKRHHYELVVIGLQFVLLLPALWFALFRTGASTDIPSKGAAVWGSPRVIVPAFVLFALAVGFLLRTGATFADETSYRFQAKVFAGGDFKAEAPPGAPEEPSTRPWAIGHRHVIVSTTGGWYSKYPLLWPLVLALPEKVNLAWMVAPLFGGILLLITGWMARDMFDRDTGAAAIFVLALSPFTLANSIGGLSHALCAALIAYATWCCWRGTASQRLGPFLGMLALLVLTFHVRIFTGFLAAVVLGLFGLWSCRKNRTLLLQVSAAAAVAGAVAIGSVLLYHQLTTGQALLSPYALYDGSDRPSDFSLNPATMLQTLVQIRRWSLQTTWLYAFPFAFPIAAYGFWCHRKSAAAQLLAWQFPVIVMGHMAQPQDSSTFVGERYYYEAYFTVAILGALGLREIARRWRVSPRMWVAAGAAILVIQAAMTSVAVYRILHFSMPYVKAAEVAHEYQNCQCAVFLTDHLDEFDARNLNLNTPEWRSSGVYYFNDPGEAHRAKWAAKFGWTRWTVLSYDPQTEQISVSGHHPRP